MKNPMDAPYQMVNREQGKQSKGKGNGKNQTSKNKSSSNQDPVYHNDPWQAAKGTGKGTGKRQSKPGQRAQFVATDNLWPIPRKSAAP